MKLNLLITFVRVVEKQSLSGAARELFLTQPAVSKHIQTLEDLYGVQLLDRVGRRIRLTEAGEVLYRHALNILRIMEDLDNSIAQTTIEVRGNLVIGASTVPGHYVLPSIIGQFKRTYPEVRVSLEIGDTGGIINNLLEQRFDLAVVGAQVKNRKLTCVFLEEDQLKLIVPTQHTFATQSLVKVEDLLLENLIWREKGSGTRMVLEKKLLEQGINPDKLQIILELGSTEAIITAVEEGLGLAFVSRWALEKSEALGRIVSLDLEGFDLQRSLYLVYPKRKVYSKAIQAFLDLIENR